MLYHKDVYLPEKIKNIGEVECQPKLTRHAQRAANSDRYGRINLPEKIKFSASDIVEVELWENCQDIKFLVRLPYDKNNDICAVVLFTPRETILKTLWLNRKIDKHSTLDKSRYSGKFDGWINLAIVKNSDFWAN